MTQGNKSARSLKRNIPTGPTPTPARSSRASTATLLRSAERHTEHDAPANHRQCRVNVLDLGRGHGHVIAVEHNEVGLFADFEGAERILLKEQIRVRARVRD